MKLQSKPGSGSFAAFLVFYGYVSFVVSIVCHVTSWQRRIILHLTFHCLLIHGCERFLPHSPGTCDVFCTLVFIYCAIIFALVFTANDRLQDISFGDPSAIPWLFSIVIRAFIRNNLLYKIHHVWAQWSWGQFCFWRALSKFDLPSIRVLWITFRCQCQCLIQVFCPYYQSHTLLLYFLQQFGNKVGEGRFRGKAVPTYVYPECIKAAIRALVSQDLRDFRNPETPTVKTCTIFENPYPTALATSFSNHRIFAFRWNIWNPFVSCYFKYCICSRCLYSHCIRICVENFQVYKVTMSDLYQAKWPGDNWSDNSNDYFDFFYL